MTTWEAPYDHLMEVEKSQSWFIDGSVYGYNLKWTSAELQAHSVVACSNEGKYSQQVEL